MKIERVVIDTNVLISAIISPHGKPRRCVDWCLDNATIVASAEMLAELETRLARPRIAKLVTPLQRTAVLVTVREAALVLPVSPIPPTCRDSDDDIVLATGISGRAACIVTGDQDLLVLDLFRDIRILTPADFLEAVGAGT
ncbi:MAG: putative toxin-antitoxin system toxin component, PIN family [Hyphomicrobiaceae bacterium]|nr:putative toxin-antitoxin system toxin component, PIN family [Hyphomicrobiaceae bacterium]